MPNRWRQVQPGLGIESVEWNVGVAEDKGKVVLAARPDVLPLGEAGAALVADLDSP